MLNFDPNPLPAGEPQRGRGARWGCVLVLPMHEAVAGEHQPERASLLCLPFSRVWPPGVCPARMSMSSPALLLPCDVARQVRT
jgi:hypothetical protein